jgi:hypothetical protein
VQQATLADIHEVFKDYVRERRRDKIKGKEGEVFSGDFFVGKHAVDLGLVDKVGAQARPVSTCPRSSTLIQFPALRVEIFLFFGGKSGLAFRRFEARAHRGRARVQIGHLRPVLVEKFGPQVKINHMNRQSPFPWPWVDNRLLGEGWGPGMRAVVDEAVGQLHDRYEEDVLRSRLGL